jgi:pantothenate synthetase
MDLLESLREKYPQAASSMTEEQQAAVLRLQERLQAIDHKVKEYRESSEHHGEPLHSYLRASGFTVDEIWIYSPQLGGEVDADEPDWV